ncbi:MAG: lipid-transfer protein [Acidimicrobiia bacterium]
MADAYDHRDRCAIAGIGSTEFSRQSGRSALTLATEAGRSAIEDAGLRPADVDGVVRCVDDVVLHNDLVESLGTGNITFWSHAGLGGTAPCAMIGHAIGAILSGQATTVLCYRSLNGRSGRRFGGGWGRDATVAGGEEQNRYDEFFHPYGLTAPGQMFAIMAQRHMIEYGTTHEQMGHIALVCRERALTNPLAQMNDRPLTMEAFLTARPISSPLRLFDYCLETDGASAVVVTSTERARDLAKPAVRIRAVAQGTGDHPLPGRAMTALLRESITSAPSKAVATELYRRAGLGPSDINVAQLYDCFTITVLIELEDYGFCGPGESGPFVEGGAIDLGGSLPINTGGGHLSEGYIHGMNHVVEGVRQMRGTSTSQVPGAGTCLVTSGIPPASSAMILTVDS